MEFVEGETLARILARLKETDTGPATPFGPKDQVDYFARLARAFAGVADGLQHAHSKGVVHRDIKPSNLILDHEERLRILDFGLAHLEGQESLTISGDVVGTPLYMSPEQALRRKVAIDHRTDVYSLGATLYEALTFQPPIRGRDHADTLSRIIERDPVDPTRVNPRVPADLGTIVLKCLRKDPADRYGTAEALAQDLRRFVRGDPIEARPQPVWERAAARIRRHRTALAVAATILALVGIVCWMAYRGGQAEEIIQAVTEEAQRARIEAQQDEYRLLVDEVLKKIHAGQYSLQVVEGEMEGLFFRFSGRSLARMAPEEIKALWNARTSHPVAEAARELAAIADRIQKPDAHYHLARAYVLLDREDDAKAELRKALLNDRDFVPAKVLLSEIDPEAPGFAAIWDEHQSTGDWRRSWLDTYDSVRQGDWADAARAYGELIALRERGEEPYIGSSVEAYVGRGMALLKLESYYRAEESFIAACTLVPGFALGALLRGKAHYLDGEKTEAEEILSEVYTDARPEERDEAALWIAGIYHAVKDYERGLYWANQLGDDVPLRDRLRCYFLFRSGEAEKAAAAGRKAIRRNEHDAVAHLVLSSALRADMGRRRGFDRQVALAELLGVCARAVGLNPANVAARDLLVTVQAEAGFHISRFIRGMAMRHPRTWGPVLTVLTAFGLSDGGAAQECGIEWLTYLGNYHAPHVGTRPDGSIVAVILGTLDDVFPEEDDFVIFGEPGGMDVVVLLVSPDGQQVLTATRFGGPADENPIGVEVAEDGTVLIAGIATTPFPVTATAHQRHYGGGPQDGFVVHLDPAAEDEDDRILYSTLVGGAGTDGAFGAHLDSDGSIVVASFTNSAGSGDIFVSLLDPSRPTGEELVFSALYGGPEYEEAQDIIDLADGTVVFSSCTFTGRSSALGCGESIPLSTGGFVGVVDLAPDSPTFGHFVFGRNIGGTGCVTGVAATSDRRGAYFAGGVSSFDLPATEDALLPEPTDVENGFLGKLDLRIPRAVVEPTLDEATGEIRLSAEASETPDGTEITEYKWTVGSRALDKTDAVVTTVLEPGRRSRITLTVTNSVGHRDTAEILVDVPEPPAFLRGDCNGDGRVDIADATCTLNWLFAGGTPGCVAALNTNGDAAVNLTDPVALLQYLFAVGPAPTAPFPECAPTASSLGCESPPNC